MHIKGRRLELKLETNGLGLKWESVSPTQSDVHLLIRNTRFKSLFLGALAD